MLQRNWQTSTIIFGKARKYFLTIFSIKEKSKFPELEYNCTRFIIQTKIIIKISKNTYSQFHNSSIQSKILAEKVPFLKYALKYSVRIPICRILCRGLTTNQYSTIINLTTMLRIFHLYVKVCMCVWGVRGVCRLLCV